MSMNCIKHPLLQPKVVAIATDKYLKPSIPFPDAVNLPRMFVPKYGQDITSSVGRGAPGSQSVGKTAEELKIKMQKLLPIFASGDKSGMAKRLFDAFLQKQSGVIYFEDHSLNLAASNHKNINDFCYRALSVPGSPRQSGGKPRIHQALKDANWDISRVIIPADLGVPAFNRGDRRFRTEDFDNGLGVMINGIQHAYVVAHNYHYDDCEGKYCITLRFIFYDVFGLDDDDLKEYGASSHSILSLDATVGITAWWQLQHQHGYAPLVTRIVVDKSYEVQAK